MNNQEAHNSTKLTEAGFLLINKPPGITSHDVIDLVRKKREVRKAGHAGTLDPMASGLLIVGIGKATKKLGEFLRLPKTYTAEITLGAESSTDDAEGETVAKSSEAAVPKREQVEAVLEKFIGEIDQVPPSYSAVKIKGVPAYKRSRRGEKIDLKSRKVNIYSIKLGGYNYPILKITAEVSSGTYIRSLARDIGKSLGVGGYLSKLVRTQIGEYSLTDAADLEDIKTAPLLPLS